MSATELDIQSVRWFARQCQVAAGVLIEPVDAWEALRAIYAALDAVPDSISAMHMAMAAMTLGRLARMLVRWNAQRPAGPPRAAGPKGHVAAALDYLLTAHGSRVTLASLSAHVGVSEAYLCELLTRTTGRGLQAHLQKIRVLHVIADLTDTREPVAVTAVRRGYRQASHLNRAFRQLVRATPTRYRRLVDAATTDRRQSMRNYG